MMTIIKKLGFYNLDILSMIFDISAFVGPGLICQGFWKYEKVGEQCLHSLHKSPGDVIQKLANLEFWSN